MAVSERDLMRTASREIILGVWVCCALVSAAIAKNTTQSAAQRPRVPANPSKVDSKVPSRHPLDRRALVRRHNVTLSTADPLTPLSVGNGEFAFTADITGLQTYPEYHQQGMALGTQSQWGWHTMPNPNGYKLADILDDYVVAGRKVPYASDKDSWSRYHVTCTSAAGPP